MKNIANLCQGGNIHLVKVPQRYRRKIAATVTAALKNGAKLFDYKNPVEVVVFSSSSAVVIPELGIVGNAITRGDIVVDIDFSRNDIARVIKKELPSTIYHELSHAVREATAGYGKTLLEVLVSEGIGSYVENKLSRRTMPYTKPIRHELKYWQRAKHLFGKKTYDHSEWFFGKGKLPRWIGYRLGYLLVDSFMKQRKGFSLAQLARIKSYEVLRGAKT